ncbi:MAG: hypothetical protein LM583_08150 [Desulfurococcaceae archaeon]|nr:hypothetical protein [Desulfurococcaceae archaeon]
MLYKVAFKWLDFGLGFATDIIIITSFLDLIAPALNENLYVDVGVGIGLSMTTIVLLDTLLPHEHTILGYEGPAAFKSRVRKFWLTALAIVLHNLSEGLVVGVATVFSFVFNSFSYRYSRCSRGVCCLCTSNSHREK